MTEAQLEKRRKPRVFAGHDKDQAKQAAKILDSIFKQKSRLMGFGG